MFKNLWLRRSCLGLLKPSDYVCQCVRSMVITDQLWFNRKNLFFRVRAMNLASLDDNLLLRVALTGKNPSLGGVLARKRQNL